MTRKMKVNDLNKVFDEAQKNHQMICPVDDKHHELTVDHIDSDGNFEYHDIYCAKCKSNLVIGIMHLHAGVQDHG